MDAEIDKILTIEHRLADVSATKPPELSAKVIATTVYGEWDIDGAVFPRF